MCRTQCLTRCNRSRLTSDERMQDANLPPEMSRLNVDLADRIIARDEEGACRISYELLHAGAAVGDTGRCDPRPGASEDTQTRTVCGAAVKEQGSKIPDEPPQQDSALLEVSRQSIIDRAAQRLDWTIVSRTPHETPHGRDNVASKQSRPGPAGIVGPWFGARLFLASVLIAVPPGIGIFLLSRPAVDKAVTDSTPAEEAPAEAHKRASSSGGPAVSPPAAGVMQGAASAGPTAVSVPTTTTADVVSSPGAIAVASAPATPPGKPEPNAAMAPALPPPEMTSTVATSPRPKPSVEQGISASEIAALLERGNALLRSGDVASARLFYERAADAGEAQGAVRLAETFDPVFLDRAYLRGVRGDFAAALSWYRRARELGATEVADRFKALEAKRGRELQ